MKNIISTLFIFGGLAVGIWLLNADLGGNDQTWNTKELDFTTNQNIKVAGKLLKDMNENEIISQSVTHPISEVKKAPWKYYGKILKIQGDVGNSFKQYPPDHDISKVLGGQAGTIIVFADEEDSNPVFYYYMGSIENFEYKDKITVYGYIIGQSDTENALGIKTVSLGMVGKVIEKATNKSEQ